MPLVHARCALLANHTNSSNFGLDLNGLKGPIFFIQLIVLLHICQQG